MTNELYSFFRIYGYRLFLLVGAVCMVALLFFRRNHYGISKFKTLILGILLLLCGIVGARLLFFIESGFTSFTGMSFFGAVFFVLIAMPLVGHFLGIGTVDTLDLCAPCGVCILAFMRFGCFSVGCCGGIYSSAGFRWPTQLMESFGDLVIMLALLHIEKKEKRGFLYPIFLISYGIQRFFIEFLRFTPRKDFGLSNGHLFALLAILSGILLWLVIHFWEGKKNNEKQIIT